MIAAFRRPALLAYAIDSVRCQTDSDWELIVSDDEPGAGEVWRMLGELIESGVRLRRCKNAGGAGQSDNMNTALGLAVGTWVKLLDDDDALKPACLARLRSVVTAYPYIASVACAADLITPRGLIRYRRGLWPRMERIRQKEILPAMYLLEDVGDGRPSQLLVARRVIAAGARFADVAGIDRAPDVCFNARIAAHGDLVILREPLALYRIHDNSTTAGITLAGRDANFVNLRIFFWSEIVAQAGMAGVRGLPSPEAAAAMIMAQRTLAHLRAGRLRDARRALSGARRLDGWGLLFFWCLHRASGGRISRIARATLADPERHVQRPKAR